MAQSYLEILGNPVQVLGRRSATLLPALLKSLSGNSDKLCKAHTVQETCVTLPIFIDGNFSKYLPFSMKDYRVS